VLIKSSLVTATHTFENLITTLNLKQHQFSCCQITDIIVILVAVKSYPEVKLRWFVFTFSFSISMTYEHKYWLLHLLLLLLLALHFTDDVYIWIIINN